MGLFGGSLNPIATAFGGLDDSIGKAFDSFTGKSQQQDANAANIASAREQMAFQERMSGTAHQREVKDLEAAGINPMLSAKLGGASSPGGAMAVSSPVPSTTRGVFNSAMDVGEYVRNNVTAHQNVAESQSREDLNRASAVKIASDADLSKSGVGARWLGTDLANWIKKMFSKGKSGVSRELDEYTEFKRKFKRKPDMIDKTMKWFLDNKEIPTIRRK